MPGGSPSKGHQNSSNNCQFIKKAYSILYNTFGPQHWWPAETPFEVMVGAILTQNTNWTNVRRAIDNLKTEGLLEPVPLSEVEVSRLAELIRPAGYFNVKAKRLKAFMDYVRQRWGNNPEAMKGADTDELRRELLQIHGIGPETADSILLYALGRPVFVVDAYTRRVLQRHGIINEKAGYNDIQALFEGCLPEDESLFNEYHALLVALGKRHCRARPQCRGCPLEPLLPEDLHKQVTATGG